MTDEIRSRPITRAQLATVFKDPRTLRAFEDLSADVATNIPQAMDATTVLIASLNTQVSTLQTDVDTLQTQVSTLQSDLNAAEIQIAALSDEVGNFQAMVGAVSATRDRLAIAIAAIHNLSAGPTP